MKPRTKLQIQKTVTKNYLALADYVIRRAGPITSLGEFCELTGLPAQSFAPLCSGERQLPMETAVITCEVFGLPYEAMFDNGELPVKQIESTLKTMKPKNKRATLAKTNT